MKKKNEAAHHELTWERKVEQGSEILGEKSENGGVIRIQKGDRVYHLYILNLSLTEGERSLEEWQASWPFTSGSWVQIPQTTHEPSIFASQHRGACARSREAEKGGIKM